MNNSKAIERMRRKNQERQDALRAKGRSKKKQVPEVASAKTKTETAVHYGNFSTARSAPSFDSMAMAIAGLRIPSPSALVKVFSTPRRVTTEKRPLPDRATAILEHGGWVRSERIGFLPLNVKVLGVELLGPHAFVNSPIHFVRVKFSTLDVESGEDLGLNLNHRLEVPIPPSDTEAIAKAVREALLSVFEHEVSESLLLDGYNQTDPHPEQVWGPYKRSRDPWHPVDWEAARAASE